MRSARQQITTCHRPPIRSTRPKSKARKRQCHSLLTLDDLSQLLQRSRKSLERDLQSGAFGPKPIRFGDTSEKPGKRAPRPYLRFVGEEVWAWVMASCPPRVK